MPVYNEEKALPAVLESLCCQVDGDGRLLLRGAFRIVVVNNASTDRSRDILDSWAGSPEAPGIVVLDEPKKGVVVARARGAGYALQSPERPIIVHADSDSLFPPTFIHDIVRSFQKGNVDVISYLGFEPTEFWARVPRLARRQLEEVGTISFSPETLCELGLDEGLALLTPQIYVDFENVPTQCGFAMTKDIYHRIGGYVQEFNSDGSERLGEARNLAFRLDRAKARFSHILSPSVKVNPRRYLLEAEDLWAGRSYTQGMTDLREEIRDEHYTLLDHAADRLNYEVSRRNAIQRYIVDPCIARPERLAKNLQYFGPALGPIRERIHEYYSQRQITFYTEVRPLSDELADAHYKTIVANLRSMRGLA